MELRNETSHLWHLEPVEWRGAGELEQSGDIARISLAGMRTQPALVGEVLQITLHEQVWGLNRGIFRC